MEQLQARIAKIAYKADGTKGWKKYNVRTIDGLDLQLDLGPEDQIPAEGSEVMMKKGPWSYSLVRHSGEERSSGGSDRPFNSSSNGSSPAGKTYPPKGREDYWQSKSDYEERERDPRIERQSLTNMVVQIYAAAIPYLDQKPQNTDEVNQYVQYAFDKGKQLFDEIKKK